MQIGIPLQPFHVRSCKPTPLAARNPTMRQLSFFSSQFDPQSQEKEHRLQDPQGVARWWLPYLLQQLLERE